MSRHAFLEIEPVSQVTADGLEKLIGTSSLHHAHVLVVEWMRLSELLVGGKEAQGHPEIPKLSVVCLVSTSGKTYFPIVVVIRSYRSSESYWLL